MVFESSESAMLLYEKVSSGKSMDLFLQDVAKFYKAKIFEVATGRKIEDETKTIEV